MNEEQEAQYKAAIAQLDAKTAQVVPQASTVGYLFWSLALPPFSTFAVMYFAWKKGVFEWQ